MGEFKGNSDINAQSIDLGDDLLENTSRNVLAANSFENIGELLENAKIFIGEGFLDDAKKVLHQVIILDPQNSMGRQLLDEVYESEMKFIFGEGADPRPVPAGVRERQLREEKEVSEEGQLRKLVSKLDEDLQLHLDGSDSLFANAEELEQFSRRLIRDLDSSMGLAQDWVDLGIAFLEMNLYSIAVRLFTQACGNVDPHSEEGRKTYLSSAGLLALALMLDDKPFEAIGKLQPLLKDQDLTHYEKINIFYLMGRNYELVKNNEMAFRYYQQVLKIDAHYRDTEHRIRVVC